MLKSIMRKILLLSFFLFCLSFFYSSNIKAQTYSSSAPVVATPVATPLIIIATPVPTVTPIAVIVATPIATSTAVVKTPVSGTADYTYLFLLIGFSACTFALYRLKCKD